MASNRLDIIQKPLNESFANEASENNHKSPKPASSNLNSRNTNSVSTFRRVKSRSTRACEMCVESLSLYMYIYIYIFSVSNRFEFLNQLSLSPDAITVKSDAM